MRSAPDLQGHRAVRTERNLFRFGSRIEGRAGRARDSLTSTVSACELTSAARGAEHREVRGGGGRGGGGELTEDLLPETGRQGFEPANRRSCLEQVNQHLFTVVALALVSCVECRDGVSGAAVRELHMRREMM